MTKNEFLSVINDLDDNLINGYLKKCCAEGETVQPFYSSPAEMPLWKRIIPAAAAICAAVAVVIGGARIINLKLSENSPANTGDSNIVDEINPEVEKANEIARDAQNLMLSYLASCSMSGYGYNGKNKTVSTIGLMVEDGVWSCESNMYGFDSTDTMGWCGSAEGITADADVHNVKSAEEELCIWFTASGDYFKDIKNATFSFIISKGECTGAAYIGLPPSELEGDYEIFNPKDYGGKFPESYNWSGGKAGVIINTTTGKPIVVGTSPVVGMSESAPDQEDVDWRFIFNENTPAQEEENAFTYAKRNAKELYATINTFIDSMEEQGITVNKLADLRTITVEISYGRYSTIIDDDLVLTDKKGKFNLRLAHAIEDEYDYSHAWIKAYIVNGECKGIVFMAGSGGESYSYPAYEDFQKGTYSWDSEEEIGSKNGITMGVYPDLAYEKIEEVTW